MMLKRNPELHAFLSTYILDAEPESDEKVTRAFVEASTRERQQQVASQARLLLAAQELSLEELGSEANRWFGDLKEARSWLSRILGVLDSGGNEAAASIVIKDSNGTPLAEGDSVSVIKDLKVKGGSSDLKRGTMIRKIHLIEDPVAIECRVVGSTLVLKTCFLRKA